MAQSIEIPVSLGLLDAKSLVDLLREMLKNSVKVDSSAFKDIERFLNKIASLADSLKGKMGEAFKTSTSSKLFLRLYEQLFGMIEAAKEKFTSLGLNDIAFSNTDAKFVDETMEKIRLLQQEITNLEKGKIGNLFDNNSIEGAEKVRAFVENLGKDIHNLTFSGLSAIISKELNNVRELIDLTDNRIHFLKTLINSLSGESLSKLSDKMLQAILGATDNNATTFKTEKLIEYRQALDEFYNSYSLFTETRINKDPAGGLNVGSFLSREAESIAKGIEAMKEKFAEYELALAKIEEIRNKGLSSTEAKGLLNDVAKLLGIDFNAMDYRTQGLAANKLTEFIEGLKGLFKSTADIDELGKEMLARLTHVFDSADLNKVINVSNLKSQLSAIFKEIGLDINDSTITLIFNAIGKNLNIDNFMSGAISQLEMYRLKKLQTMDETIEANNRLKLSEEELKNILSNVNMQDITRNDNIKLKQIDIENLRASLNKLVDEINKLNGTNFKIVDPNPIKLGTTALTSYISNLSKLENKLKALSSVLTAITRWMGFYQVLNLTKRAVNSMKLHILELDTVMTKIAVVTNMTLSDLWNQIGKYSEIARQYGVAIKGVYEVSLIYYQLGLKKDDVMGLTTETLKMARIAGIDYATAADYMTTAIRGFKLEMSDATHVTDVFSNLAAHTASSTEELATAISKTAASAASVGASFESTSAMMATMIATTRESATNIGTALKSIISRYGEMKANPEGTDSEGEEYSLNKVDKALQSIGISIHDVNGQFRNFDDVILELAEAWDSVDTNTQRYIATVMAGNRQQSRFLSLISNVEEYKRALELANNADSSGELLVLKTLDSVDAKLERLKVTVQEFYTSSGILDLYKDILDTITNVISGANALPKVFGKIPALALTVGFLIVNIIKNVAKLAIQSVAAEIETLKGSSSSVLSGIISLFTGGGKEAGAGFRQEAEKEINQIGTGVRIGAKGQLLSRLASSLGSIISMAGSTLSIKALSNYGASTSKLEDQAAAGSMFGAAALTAGGSAISGAATGFMMGGGVPGAVIGGAVGLLSGIPSLVSAIEMNTVTIARELELSNKALTEAKLNETLEKGKTKELESAYIKLLALYENLYDSVESMQEYKDYMNELAETFPYLIDEIEGTGDCIIDLTSLEEALATARLKTALATADAAKEELKNSNKRKDLYKEILSESTLNLTGYTIAGNPNNWYADLAKAVGAPVYTNTTLGVNLSTATLWNILNKYEEWRQLLPNADSYKVWEGTTWLNYGRDTSDFRDEWGEASLNQFIEYSLRNGSGDALSLMQSKMALTFMSKLKIIKDKFTQGGETFNLGELLGDQDITDIEEIKDWSISLILDANDKLKSRLEIYVNNVEHTIEGIEEAVADANISLGVLHNLESLKNPHHANELNKYNSLMTFMLSGRYAGKTINWESSGNQAIITGLRDWIDLNQDVADELMSIDYSLYRVFDDIQFSDEVKEIPGWNEYLEKSFRPAFEEMRSNITKGLTELLKNAGLGESKFINFFDNNKDNGELNTALISSLRTSIKQYLDLKELGYVLEAENYLTNVERVYSVINEYDSAKLTEISSIITDLDLNDAETLTKAEAQLRELGPLFDGLANELELATARLTSNIVTKVTQLHDNAKKIIESVEKVADLVGKVTKASDAFENMQTILKTYTGSDKDLLTFDKLYTWDNELLGYILTSKGTEVWLNSINNENAEKLNEAEMALKEAKVLYGENATDGAFTFDPTDLILRYLVAPSIYKQLLELYSDESGKLTISEDKFTALYNRYIAEYQGLQNLYEQAKETNENLTWEQFIEDKRKTLVATSEAEIEMLKSLPKNTLLSKITSLDFKAIAGGTGNKSLGALRAMLYEAVRDSFDNDRDFDIWFTQMWNLLLEGRFDILNGILAGTGFLISQETLLEAGKSNAELIANTIKTLQSGIEFKNWTKENKEVIRKYTNRPLQVLKEKPELINQTIQELYDALGQEVDGVKYTVELYNQDLLSFYEYMGLGQTKAGIDLISNGFSLSEFNTYLQLISPGTLINEYWDNTTKLFKLNINNINLNDLVEYDEITDSFKAKTGITLENAKEILMLGFNITAEKATEIWNSLVDNDINKIISTLDSADMGKRGAMAISSIANAKVGTRINVSGLSKEMQEKLDGTADGIYEITSEFARDTWIMSLNANDLTQDLEWRNAVREALNSIKLKHNLYNNFKNILSSTINLENAEAYLRQELGSQFETPYSLFGDNFIKSAMKARGYEWDEYTQLYRATTDAITEINNEIKDAIAAGASLETINELRLEALRLETELNKDYKKEALINLLNNYTNISEDILNEFKTQFTNEDGTLKVDIEKYISRDGAGNIELIDFEGLLLAMSEAGVAYSEVFDEYIAALADEYINNAQKATLLISLGTTSLAEIKAFKLAYSQLMNMDIEFNYDSVLKAWTFDASLLSSFIEKLADKLELVGEERKQWIKDLIDTITIDNLDFSKILAGTANEKELAQLLKNLIDYYKTHASDYNKDDWDNIEEYAKTLAQSTLLLLSIGGQTAINELKSIKTDLTTEEIEAAYRSLIAPIEAVYENLANLQEGSIVAKNLILILNAAGFEVNKDGVIEAVGDLTVAYQSIYELMKNTGEATIKELNNSYASYLTSRNLTKIDIVSTLTNASSMTYKALGELLESYHYTLEEIMINADKYGIEEIGNDQISIKNWESFLSLFNMSDTDLAAFSQTFEYLNAYSTYVDGLIQLDTLFLNLIKQSYDNAFNSIALFKLLNVSLLSKDILASLEANGAATITNGILTVTNALEYARNAETYFALLSSLSAKELYNQTGGWTTVELALNWKAILTILTLSLDAWLDIGKSLTSVTADLISTLIEKGGLKIGNIGENKLFEQVGDHYVMTLQNYALELAKSMAHNGQIDEAAYNKAFNEATLGIFNNISGLDWTKVFDGTATNADLDTFRSSLRDNLAALGLKYSDYVSEAGDLNVNALLTDLGSLDQALVDHIELTIAEILNNILSSITSASNYVYEGTNSISDMLKFVDDYNKIVGTSLSVSDLFTYDTNLDLFTLNSINLKTYIDKLKVALKDLGMSGEAINEYIKDQTSTLMRQNMDITSILDDTDKISLQKSISILASLIRDYWNITVGEEIKDSTLKYIIDQLYAGGASAVETLKGLKGDEVTSEEIEAVYKAGINRITAAQEALELGEGTILLGMAAEIAKVSDGIEISTLPDGSVVITSVTSMTDAYSRLYAQMNALSEKTTTSLNSLYAKFLTSIELPEADAISTLNDAMGMSYEALGEMLSKYGKSLEEYMANASERGLRSLGNGTVQIYDFDVFAASMEWKPGSNAYIEARKSYNDSLIELDKKIGLNLTEEIKSITEAKAGDRVNLTYLASILDTGVGIAGHYLLTQLTAAGAEFSKGILTLHDNANIPAILLAVTEAAKTYQGLLPEELAELADAINDYIENIINLIKNGISGSLNNVDAQLLQSWADLFNIKLDFTKTAEGLKLSLQSSIELYNALKKVDSVKAKLVFDELNKSLKEANERYKSISDVRSRIIELENMGTGRTEALEQELALAKEILAVRSTSEDEGFNFMSNKIPGALNNPLNYFNNWASAILKLQEAMKVTSQNSTGTHKGLIDYQDWYNVVTEMNNLATKDAPIILSDALLLDGTMEAAAKAIEAGARALTTTNTGDIKVALGDIGIDFEAGSDAMSAGITSGIQDMAKSQVKMLDGMIRLLETIVAMEKLGDVTGGDNLIDFSDFFTINDKTGTVGLTEANKLVTDWVNYLLDLDDKESDLYKALDQIKVNNESLRTLLSLAKLGNLKVEDALALTSVLNSMWLMYQSGEWDLDNLYSSLAAIAELSGLGGELTLDIDDTTLIIRGGLITQIDWSDDNTKEVLERWKQANKGDKKELLDEVLKYHAGEALTTDSLEFVLKLERKLYLNDDKTYTVNINGKTLNLGKLDESELEHVQRWTALLDKTGMDIPLKDGKPIDIKTAEPTVELETEVNVTSKINVLYDSKEGIIYEYNGYTGSSLEELTSNLIENDTEFSGLKEEQVLWLFGIRAKVEAKVTVDEKEVSLKTDPNTRQNIINALDDKTWLDNIPETVGDDGNLTFTLGKATITVPGGEVTTEDGATIDTTKLEDYIRGQLLDMDLGLSETIAEGIKKAFGEVDDSKIKEVHKEVNETQKATNDLNETLNTPKTIDVDTTAAMDAIEALNAAASASVTKTVYVKEVSSKTSIVDKPGLKNPSIPAALDEATGNIGLAKAQGTLMGELGPELVVSGGRYFVAGLNGPEMIDLADDAIVFNHLQTKSLLEKGMSSGRGKAVTNEYNAVAFAKGNINGGPAMAGASAALAALKQLRAQWQALANLSAQDLAGKGGGGGGGGGDDNKAFLKDLERWYNWLQHIALLEKEITLELSKRTKYQSDMYAHGQDYYASLKATLDLLQQQTAVQMSLTSSLEEYFEKRRKQLSEDSALSAIFGYSKSGLLYYKSGEFMDGMTAFEWFSDLMGRDEITGKANYTAEEQYNKLVAAGLEKYMKYDSSGNEIKLTDDSGKADEKAYATAVQAIWDLAESDLQEMQSLHDAIEDGKNSILSLENERNLILKEIEDNLISVENKVLKAIEDSRLRAIDDSQDERDAIENSAKEMIDGLNQQLSKERLLYENQQNADELSKLLRQLGILLRSGGSAAEIASLQELISEKQLDAYFTALEQQIEALLEASDALLERLDHQIELMTETLEYEKAHGLLWNQVYDVLSGSPEEIAAYILANDSSYWGKSLVNLDLVIREDLKSIEAFKAFQADIDGGMEALKGMYNDLKEKEASDEATQESKLNENEAELGNTAVTEPVVETNTNGSGGGSGDNNTPKKPAAELVESEKWISDGLETHHRYVVYADGHSEDTNRDEKHTFKNGVCTKCGQKEASTVYTATLKGGKLNLGEYGSEEEARAVIATQAEKIATREYPNVDEHTLEYIKKSIYDSGDVYEGTSIEKALAEIQAFKNSNKIKAAGGGYVGHGVYELGERGIETVLTARQTQILRNDILSTRRNSLMNLLVDFRDAYSGLSNATYDSINKSEQLIIENATVEMNVSRIANDYDAQRAGEQALDKMLQIARKTLAQNRIG